MAKRSRRRVKYEQHVRLHHWLLSTLAYRSLSPPARAVLVELMRVYNGTNNGRLALSVRDAGGACCISKNTAARAFDELADRGFIVQTKPGAFSVKFRLATEWALTEFRNDATGAMASKDFVRWTPKIQNTVPPEGHRVPVAGHQRA